MSQPAVLAPSPTDPAGLLGLADFLRLDATRKLHREQRARLGQFFTPAETASLMASMFSPRSGHLRILDAGAGVGSLSAALLGAMCGWPQSPTSVHLMAYEIDSVLADYLGSLLRASEVVCHRYGIRLQWEVRREDFVAAAVGTLRGDLFRPERLAFDCAILNPPYGKFRSDSPLRMLLRSVGVETSNLYSAFLALAVQLMASGGELVAITPRSFCNGPYFRPFRQMLLREMTLRRIHVFEARDRTFRDDSVLQENVILHAAKSGARDRVLISSSSVAAEAESARAVEYAQVVRPDDPQAFIHLVPQQSGQEVAQRMRGLGATLADLGLSVSTGPVVDFRVKRYLRAEPAPGDAPLLYPGHLSEGSVVWPRRLGKKPTAIAVAARTLPMLVPCDVYVLVKRFSAKEERRRLVAATLDPSSLPAPLIGLENHLNYFHMRGAGLPARLAKGLAAFLNSTLADAYFRQFNGHTQVNATDLRALPYPRRDQLEAIGCTIDGAVGFQQDQIDSTVEEVLFNMPQRIGEGTSPHATRRIHDAIGVLRALGMPRSQQNERSALALLALLDLRPGTPWARAKTPLMGVTEIMDYAASHYGWQYAPNTRETFRRQTLHQFVAGGLVLPNPDKPTRPINSPDYCYQIEPSAVEVLRAFGSTAWEGRLRAYLASVETLKRRYAAEREMERIPLSVAPGKKITLSPGGQNELVHQVVTGFCERFTPGAQVLYVGDTNKKWAYFDKESLNGLGVEVDPHGKMPDVVVFDKARGWLVLVEAVTSHGPVDPKRREELESLFAGCKAGLVFVTAFLTRHDLLKYLGDIAWETEVWVAESPSHMIHFNGERFLGPF